MRLMLDTNICIYTIKQKPAEVLARSSSHAVGDIAVGKSEERLIEEIVEHIAKG